MIASFRCKVGGEWQPLSSFSKSQQRLIQGHCTRIDATNSGMTCREHTAAIRAEARCELCNLIKPLAEFIKSNKKQGDYVSVPKVVVVMAAAHRVADRFACAAPRGETQEPEVTPAYLATGHISVEERTQEVWKNTFTDSADFFPDDMPQVCTY